jgi:hypothetical protein
LIVGTKQCGAHSRVDAVRADDHVGLDLAAALKPGHRQITVRFDGRAALAQRDAAVGQRRGDHVEQVGAVNGGAAEAERVRLMRTAHLRDHAARPPVSGH